MNRLKEYYDIVWENANVNEKLNYLRKSERLHYLCNYHLITMSVSIVFFILSVISVVVNHHILLLFLVPFSLFAIFGVCFAISLFMVSKAEEDFDDYVDIIMKKKKRCK